MFYICSVNGGIYQVWPEGHIHPDDICNKESIRAAAGGHASCKGASRAAVCMLKRVM